MLNHAGTGWKGPGPGQEGSWARSVTGGGCVGKTSGLGSHQEGFGAMSGGFGGWGPNGPHQEGLGSRAPCLALAHPQEVIIHQKQPFKATCVVEDHSGRAKPPFNLFCKAETRVRGWARHRLRQTQKGHRAPQPLNPLPDLCCHLPWLSSSSSSSTCNSWSRCSGKFWKFRGFLGRVRG